MSFRKLVFLVPLFATAGFLAPWGCSAAGGGDGDTSANAPTSSSTGPGSGGGGGTGPTSGSGGEGGGLVIGTGGSGQGGSNLDPDAACASTSAAAQIVPLDMIVLLDKSSSMTGARWNGAVAALQTFFSDPESDGINVGLQYYPQNNGSCDYTIYDDLTVPIAALPLNTPVLNTSLDDENPDGVNTPTYGALRGVLFKATAQQDANPDHKVVVVFASDGAPNGCSTQDTTAAIAGLASQALSYNGVQTYVIAMSGSDVANLSQIAQAGGTVAAYDVTGDITQFSQKMKQIRANAMDCTFPIPPPPMGEELDLAKVAVNYTNADGDTIELPRKSGSAQCGSGSGWHFDKPITSTPPPTEISLCPASCSAIRASTANELHVLFGCAPDVD
ncbi:vWA domain-containing protein [Chondromyces apiculatus]|uniref:VWFA domain-containing protein n=1 Tax=Chondromyces apiculatus DSM 436 TaxID=1192034 RepID=A0A017SWY1_9BACT|nr:vWA domain-containing protein [Chondromyces apiculatus]EYF01282.1 Hypothetical protein CAP_8436 [Chondromyces apiculatus DSM 436]